LAFCWEVCSCTGGTVNDLEYIDLDCATPCTDAMTDIDNDGENDDATCGEVISYQRALDANNKWLCCQEGEVGLTNVNLPDGKVDVYFNSVIPIKGAEFNLPALTVNCDMSGTTDPFGTDGLALDNGWNLSCHSTTNLYLAVDFSAENPISAQEGILFTINFTDIDKDQIGDTGWLCLEGAVLAAADGTAVSIGSPELCACGFCPADVNGDGGYNVLDVVALVNDILQSPEDAACSGDYNDDGSLDVLDIVAIVNCVLAGNCGVACDADASDDNQMDGPNQEN